MNWKAARLTISTAILAFATALAAWGTYRIVTFGEPRDDPSFYISDGPPSLFWGCLLLLMGYFMRFRFRLHALSLLAAVSLVLLGWSELRQSKNSFGFEFFYAPLAVCAVLFILVLLDRYIQSACDFVRRKTTRRT